MSKSSPPPPRKCRFLWLCLLALAFLFSMPATYAKAQSPYCPTPPPEPTASFGYDSSYFYLRVNFNNSNPNTFCWKVDILSSPATSWRQVDSNCAETRHAYSGASVRFGWEDENVAPAGDNGLIRMRVNAVRVANPGLNCSQSIASEWVYVPAQPYQLKSIKSGG